MLDSLDTAGSGQFSKFGDRMEELGDLMTRRQMTMGEEIDFESMISALQAERSGISLDESAYTKITAERSGYYISSTDGLEGVLPYGKIASVTQDMLQKALEAKAQPASGGVGKMVDSFDWYLLCAVDEKQALHFEQGDSIMVRMPFSAAGEFKAEVEHIAQSEDGKNLVTLKCNLMNETFANLRQETAQLVTNVTVYYAKPQAEEGTDEQEAPKPKQYVVDKGIRVSTSAVRVVDGEKGVYVRRGNVARFRKLNIVYSDQTYVISATASQDGEPIVDDPSNYLKQYDEVILEGKDLYDGKSSADPRFAQITENYKRIRENIAAAAEKSGRMPGDIRFMAVTKTVEPVYINHALSLGISLIGENKVQEYLGKREYLNLAHCEKHLIGHLQTNKVRQIVGEVDMIESVDSLRLAQEISRQSMKREITTPVLLEVNIGGEESKTGMAPAELEETACAIAQMPGIQVCGLMAIPPICEEESVLRGFFSDMRRFFVDMKAKK